MAAFWKRKTEKSESMTAQTLLDFLGVSTTDSSRLSEATYFACLKILGETLGKLPLKLLQHTDKNGVIKAYKHPLYAVLGSRPNPYMTATHFWSRLSTTVTITVTPYVWITGAGQKTKLWILPSDAVKGVG